MAESPIAFAHPQPLIAQFDLPDLTSDGGLPWLAEADTQLGLYAALAAPVSEWRRGPVRHTRETLVRQRVFQLAVAMPIIRHPKFQPSRQRPILEARQRPNPCKEVRPMGTAIKRVTTVDELVSATQDSGIRRIVV